MGKESFFERDLSLSDSLWFELLAQLPNEIFSDDEQFFMHPVVINLIAKSNNNGAEFGNNLPKERDLKYEEKEEIAEALTILLLEKIHYYQEQIKSQGPHSKLGEFYRKTIQKFEKVIFNMIDNLDFLSHYYIRLEDTIQQHVRNNPQVLPFEVFEEVLQVGRDEIEAGDGFLDTVVLGSATMLGDYIFEK